MFDQQFSVRPLKSIDDFLKAEQVQIDIWAMEDRMQAIPVHVLLTAQENGGLVAGAFDSAEQMIGILFGFIGQTHEGKIKHCSHIMGVLPSVRRQSVGQALKLFQREHVLRQGFDLVTWTFDPLEGVNASLNIGKLGAITRTFKPDHYGNSMTDELNRGLPTDRFEVEWWIDTPRVREILGGTLERPGHTALLNGGAQLVNQTELDRNGALRPVSSDFDLDPETLLVEIPPEFQAIKAISKPLALEWRHASADALMHYFAKGYAVTDFISDREDSRRRNFYVLTRDFTP